MPKITSISLECR